MVQYLKQLLLSPGCAALPAQVVEQQERSVAHPFEKLIVGYIAAGTERRAQVVEQGGDGDEKHGGPFLQAAIGYSCRQMGLAAAARPAEHQPAFGIFGKPLSYLKALNEPFLILRVAAATSRQQVIEGKTG